MRARSLRLAVVFAVLVCAAPATAAAAADNTRLIATLEASNARFGHGPNVDEDLLFNCEQFFSGGLALQGNPPVATIDGTATGTLNPRTRSGEVFARRNQWQVEALSPSHARPVTFTDLGFALRGSNLFLTGRLTHGRPFSAGARRKKLAVARHVQVTPGPLLDAKRHPVAGTYAVLMRGKLRMLATMARPIERLRCRGSRNRQSKRPKPGYRLGKLTGSYRPSVASGLAGSADLPPGISTVDTGDPVPLEPTGGMTVNGDGHLVGPFASGLPVPVFCFAGEDCQASGGTVGLGGGFDLVLGGARASVTNVAVTTSGKPPLDLQHTVTGFLDGAPVTIAANSPDAGDLALTPDFMQRASADLGRQIYGFFAGLTLTVTSVGP